LRKTVVVVGLVLLITGLAVSVFPSQEEQIETTTDAEWDLQSKTVLPQNSTFFGKLMRSGMWFQLNVSASDLVLLRVSITQYPNIKNPFFTQFNTKFNQTVTATDTGTYWIDIENENEIPVILDGKVLVMKTETRYENIHPYALPGVAVMFVGIAIVMWGAFAKTKEPLRTKRKTPKTHLHSLTQQF
jgi:uncharacterized membrane protein